LIGAATVTTNFPLGINKVYIYLSIYLWISTYVDEKAYTLRERREPRMRHNVSPGRIGSSGGARVRGHAALGRPRGRNQRWLIKLQREQVGPKTFQRKDRRRIQTRRHCVCGRLSLPVTKCHRSRKYINKGALPERSVEINIGVTQYSNYRWFTLPSLWSTICCRVSRAALS